MDKQRDAAVLKEGFLVKRGHVVLNWKARWFVLHPDKLVYYKYEGSKKESSQRGQVELSGCVVTCPYLEYETRPLVLKLQTRNSAEYFLEACSREDRDEWAAAIAGAAAALRPADTPPAPDAGSAPAGSLRLHNVSLNQVVDSMYDVHSGIKLMSHVEQGNSYTNCFTGSSSQPPLITRTCTHWVEEGGLTLFHAFVSLCVCPPLQKAETFKKRGSVKAETSLSAVEMSGKVMKRGFLLKQGHKRKNWKVRLFVLRADPSYLHYYDPSRDDINPVGGFSLRGCLVSALDDNGIPSGDSPLARLGVLEKPCVHGVYGSVVCPGVKGKVQGNLFKIITQAETHYFIQAPTRQEKMEWIEAIKRLT
ncbi:pleckstrin-2 [Arapaima gigas]